MNHRMTFRICILAGLAVPVLALSAHVYADESLPDASLLAYAKNRKPPKPPTPPTISDVTLNGTITVAASNGLTIKASKTSKAKNLKQWFVASQAETDVRIHGTATLDYVKKGQTVEFTAQIVNNEKLAEPLKEFTIVAHKSGKVKKNEIAKDHAAGPAAGAAGAAKADADGEPSLGLPDDTKPAAPGAKPDAVGPKTHILGKVAAVDSKSLTVTAGERTIHADLVSIPTINVEISDPKVMQDPKDNTKLRIEGPGASGHLVSLKSDDLIGAKIIVRGTGEEFKPGTSRGQPANQCAAKDMDVTLARPLTGTKPTTPAPKKELADK